MKIIVKYFKESKKRKSFFWRERKPKKTENYKALINHLKSEKKDFKILENRTEKLFIFNGNNYHIYTYLTYD